MMKLIRKHHKKIAVLLVITFIQSFVEIPKSFALTGGNTMPEYRSFEPVSTSNMVNLFDGSFTYNLPLLDVPNGYPINLSYHSSAINNEADAGWVGLGFSLNPGAINRIKRGFPDEFNGEEVQYYNKMPSNVHIGFDFQASLKPEVFGLEKIKNSNSKFLEKLIGAGGNYSPNLGGRFEYNSLTGFHSTYQIGGLSAGVIDMNLSYSKGKVGFSPKLNFSKLLEKKKNNTEFNPYYDKTDVSKPPPVLPTFNRVNTTSFTSQTSVSYMQLGGRGSSFSMGVSSYIGATVKFKYDFGLNSSFLPAEITELQLAGDVTVKDANGSPAPINVYGYMHSEGALASGKEKSMMDYYTEMDDVFDLKQRYLGAPIPNNDFFSVSGQGIGGTIRPFRTEWGHYRKNKVKSYTSAINGGIDVGIPSPTSALISNGFNIGGEYGEVTVKGWEKGDVADYSFHDKNHAEFNRTNEPYVMRYAGDMGGSFNQAGSDEPIQATPSVNPTLDTENETIQKILKTRVPRTSFVSAKSNEVTSNKVNEIAYKNYQKDFYIKVANRNDPSVTSIEPYERSLYNANSMGEISTIGSNGMRYVYGLPLYNREERQLTYALNTKDVFSEINEDIDLVANVANNNVDLDGESNIKTGYHNPSEYSNQFLLTEIVSPDYIDITNNGPSTDDFGSYTKFNYTRYSGGKDGDDWYTFKSPFDGATINWGSQSTSKDDRVSFSAGQKEIYYLESIVSKTHVALFKTEERLDGLSASKVQNNNNTENELLINDDNGVKKNLRYLDRIELFAISDCTEENGFYTPKENVVPIKTVRFDYNYELCPNTPNSTAPAAAGATRNHGKLTLKKVWFEYEGKKTHKISPYEFEYNYPTDLSLPQKYTENSESGSIYNFGEEYTLPEHQNPSYNLLNTDRWGCFRDFTDQYQKIGNLARNFPYVNQNPSANFDPAAWCLKRIKLPSGGQILVQYEQNDYQFVQNKRADVMVPLSNEINFLEGSNKRYYLDLSVLGLNYNDFETSAQKMDLLEDLFEKQIEENDRLFFNFYYRLLGLEKPTYGCRSAENINGYAKIHGVGYDDQKEAFYFSFKSEKGSTHYKKIGKTSKLELPRTVCKDFYLNQRVGLLNENSCDEDELNGESKASFLENFASKLGQLFASSNDNICVSMEPKYSYVRLQMPTIKKKRGGGVRVKRLLSYDDALSTNTGSVLYGNEYIYETHLEKGNDKSPVISSGVATTEPGIGRNENALVKPLHDEPANVAGIDQKVGILYGPELAGEEGPLGESLLPAPSIGYSKVRVQSIHKGVTSSGYAIHSYYTCRDKPFKVKETDIDKKGNFPITAGKSINNSEEEVYKKGNAVNSGSTKSTTIGANISVYKPRVSQGYSFISNAMHGQPISSATYPKEGTKPTTLETYEYVDYEKNEQVLMMDENHQITSQPIWRESEILSESRVVSNFATSGQVGVDYSASPPTPTTPPAVYVTGTSLNFSYMENTIKSHVTTKLINYPAVVKKVTSLSDGITHVSENIAFDKFTGQPVIVQTQDDFNNPYVSIDFKASWHNKHLRGKYINEGLIIKNATYQNTDGVEALKLHGCGDGGLFIAGDFIELDPDQTSTCKHLYHVSDVDEMNDQLIIVPSQLNNCTLSSGSTIGEIEVIRSGYTNELNLSDGGIVTYGENLKLDKIDEVYVEDQFVDDLNTKVNEFFSIEGNRYPGAFGTFILPNTYTNLYLPIDKCIIPEGTCGGVPVSNLEFEIRINHDQTWNLKLINADVQTTSGIVEIGCQTVAQMEQVEYNTQNYNNPISNTNASCGNCKSNPNGSQYETQCGDLPDDYTEKKISFKHQGTVYLKMQNNNYTIRSLDKKEPKGWSRSILPYETFDWFSHADPVNDFSLPEDSKVYVEKLSSQSESDDYIDFTIQKSNKGRREKGFVDFRRPGEFYKFKSDISTKGGIINNKKKSASFYGHVCVENPLPLVLFEDAKVPLKETEYYAHGYPFQKNDDGTDKLQTYKSNIVEWTGEQSSISFTLTAKERHQYTVPYTGKYTWSYVGNNEGATFNPSTDLIDEDKISPSFIFHEPAMYEFRLVAKDIDPIQADTDGDGEPDGFELEYKVFLDVRDVSPCHPIIQGDSELCLEDNGLTPTFTFSNYDENELDNCTNIQSATWTLTSADGQHTLTSSSIESFTPSVTADFLGECEIKLEVTKNPNGGSLIHETTYQQVTINDCRTPVIEIVQDGPSCPGKVYSFSIDNKIDSKITEVKWELGDGTIVYATEVNHVYNACGPMKVKAIAFNGNKSAEDEKSINTTLDKTCHPICDCYESLPIEGLSTLNDIDNFTDKIGYFQSDAVSGTIEFIQVSCPNVGELGCLSLCKGGQYLTDVLSLDKTISASAATFNDYWPYDQTYYPQVNNEMNEYEKGERGRWRVAEQYTYRDNIIRGYTAVSGTFELELFNWKNPSLNTQKWVKTTTVTKYSPNGEAIEDKNILGIKSTSKYGYNRTLPVLVAQNAADHSVLFESFEKIYAENGASYFEDGVLYSAGNGTQVSSQSHTGEYSIQMSNNWFEVGHIELNDQLMKEGVMIRAWFKHDQNPDALNGILTAKIADVETTFEHISGAGEWQLYEAKIKGLKNGGTEKVFIQSQLIGSGTVYMDDVRAQPEDAEMVTYVYDHVQRLVAVMDDQHYAMLYQYDIEGSLVRKLKETVEGIKTISNKQYNIKGKPRTEANFLENH